jgi:hypothetical protein
MYHVRIVVAGMSIESQTAMKRSLSFHADDADRYRHACQQAQRQTRAERR